MGTHPQPILDVVARLLPAILFGGIDRRGGLLTVPARLVGGDGTRVIVDRAYPIVAGGLWVNHCDAGVPWDDLEGGVIALSLRGTRGVEEDVHPAPGGPFRGL